jgi:hypothetical protein
MKNLFNGSAAKVIAIIAAALLFVWGATYFIKKNPEQSNEAGSNTATTTAKSGTIGSELKKAAAKKTSSTATKASTGTVTAAPDPKEATSAAPVIGVDLNMIENQSVQLVGTDITLTIEFVQDMTSAGCVGSPSSCVDKVDISMKKDFDVKFGTMYSPSTVGVVAGGTNQTTLFGYKVTLLSMKQKSVILRVESVK